LLFRVCYCRRKLITSKFSFEKRRITIFFYISIISYNQPKFCPNVITFISYDLFSLGSFYIFIDFNDNVYAIDRRIILQFDRNATEVRMWQKTISDKIVFESASVATADDTHQ
jgi:hypothetical protein